MLDLSNHISAGLMEAFREGREGGRGGHGLAEQNQYQNKCKLVQ